MLYAIPAPAGENTVGIFKTGLMSRGNSPSAGFLYNVGRKAVVLGPFSDICKFGRGRPSVFNAEGIENRIAVPAVQHGLLFGLGNRPDPFFCPGKSDFSYIMHAFMSVFHAGFNQVFDEFRRHVQRFIKISDCIHICAGQSFSEILFRNKKERFQFLLRAKRVERHGFGCRGGRSLFLVLYGNGSNHSRGNGIFSGSAGPAQLQPGNSVFGIPHYRQKPGGLPVAKSAQDVLLSIIQAVGNGGDCNGRTRVVQMTQQKEIYLYKFAVGVRHIMVDKIIRQQSRICLKFVFQCQSLHKNQVPLSIYFRKISARRKISAPRQECGGVPVRKLIKRIKISALLLQ